MTLFTEIYILFLLLLLASFVYSISSDIDVLLFFLKKDDAHDALYIFMSRKEQRERERERVSE